MELTATAVNWNNFVDVVSKGQLCDILFEEIEYDKELELNDTPWSSDSSLEYIEVASELASINEASEDIMMISNGLINENFQFPCELDCEIDPELIAGAFSPETVKQYSGIFERLDMSGLSQSAVEYLNQWKLMFDYSNQNNAGVYLHLG